MSAIREAISSLRESEEEDGGVDIAESERQAKEAAKAEAHRLLMLGVEKCQVTDIEKAVESFQDAYLVYVKITDRKSAALCMKILSLLFTALKDPAFVKRAFARAENQLRQAGLPDEAARMIMLRARFEASESDRYYRTRDFKSAKEGYKTAVASYKQARKAFHALAQLDGEAVVVLELAELEASRADKCSAAKLVSEIIDAAKLVNRHDIQTQAEDFAKKFGL